MTEVEVTAKYEILPYLEFSLVPVRTDPEKKPEVSEVSASSDSARQLLS